MHVITQNARSSSISSSYSGSGSGSGSNSGEIAPLIRAPPAVEQNDRDEAETGKDRLLFNAAYTMTSLLAVVALEVIIPLVLLFINLFVGFTIPLLVTFVLLWVGHLVYGFLIYNTFRDIHHSLSASSNTTTAEMNPSSMESMDFILRGRNEERIPMVRYILDHLSWSLFCYVMLLITQVVIYLAVVGLVSPISYLIPIYIVIGLFLSTAVLCKSTHILQVSTLLCLLAALILCNIKLVDSSALAWFQAFIPLLLLSAVWFLVLLRIAIGAATSYYELQQSQLEAMVNYFIAVVALVLAIWYLAAYLDDNSSSSALFPLSTAADIRIAVGLFIVAAVALAVALIVDVQAHVELQVFRMGAARPLELTRSSEGGWEVDEDANYHHYLILGELEISQQWRNVGGARSKTFVSHSILLGCCVSTIQLVGRRFSYYDSDDDSDRGGGQAVSSHIRNAEHNRYQRLPSFGAGSSDSERVESGRSDEREPQQQQQDQQQQQQREEGSTGFSIRRATPRSLSDTIAAGLGPTFSYE